MTVINRRHKFVYLKSEKTAGTALEAHFLTETEIGGDIWHTAPNIRKYGLSVRRRPYVIGSLKKKLIAVPKIRPLAYFQRSRQIEEHHAAAPLAALLGDFWESALKVTSVRNPWDIMVSAWQWRREGRGNSPPVTASFEEWTRACISGDPELQARVYGYDAKALMYPYLFIDDRLVADVLIRREAIQEGLDEIGKRLGITSPTIQIRENQTFRQREHRSFYTDRLGDAVGRYFAEIIDLCGYTFDQL